MRNAIFWLLLGLMVFLSVKVSAQTWVTHYNSDSVFSIHFPNGNVITAQIDTPDIEMVSLAIDSGIDSTTIAFQVFNSTVAQIDTSNELWDQALDIESGDTLKAITRILATVSNSTVLSYQQIDTVYSGVTYKGMEAGFEIEHPVFNQITNMYVLMYMHGSGYVVAIIMGRQADIVRLENYRDLFFGSLTLYN